MRHFFESPPLSPYPILEDFVDRPNNNMDGDFLHLATALDPQWKAGRGQVGVLVQAESQDGLDLLKGEKDVARDKVGAPKPKRRLLDINESDNESDGERERERWMSSPGFEILAFANEFLNCFNRY